MSNYLLHLKHWSNMTFNLNTSKIAATTISTATLSTMLLSKMGLIAKLSISILCYYSECQNFIGIIDCCYAKRHYAEGCSYICIFKNQLFKNWNCEKWWFCKLKLTFIFHTKIGNDILKKLFLKFESLTKAS